MSNENKEEILKKIAEESPLARFAESIKENKGIEIADSVFKMQEAQAEKEAAIKKYEVRKQLIAAVLASVIIEKARGKHRKLLLIASYTSADANETPLPFLENLFTKALKEDKGEFVFRADTLIVRKEGIRAIDSSLLLQKGNDLPALAAMLDAACGKKIPFEFVRTYDDDRCAIRIGRISV